jgi:hypothetical protein
MSSAVTERTQTLATLTLRRTPSALVHHPTGHAGGLSAGAIVLVVLAAVLVLACLAWGLVRMLAYEPRWVAYARHSVAEAQERASSICAELGDWMRLGH